MREANSPKLNAVRALNERLNARLAEHNNTHANNFKGEHNRLLSGLDAIVHIRANPNIAETPAAHILRLSKAANKLKDEAAKAKTKAFNNYLQYKTAITSELMSVTGMDKPSPYASEIRAAVKGMEMKDRLEYLRQLAESGDGSSFAAIINAPEILTGVPRNIADDYSKVLFKSKAPELVQMESDVTEAMDIMEQTLQQIDMLSQEYSDPVTVSQIEEEIRKSLDAQAKFDSAMG